MKRRNFIKTVGCVSGLVAAQQNLYSGGQNFTLKKPNTWNDLKNSDGLVAVRLEIQPYKKRFCRYELNLKVIDGELDHLTPYFVDDNFGLSDTNHIKGLTASERPNILVLWLKDATPETSIQISARNNDNLQLATIFKDGIVVTHHQDFKVSYNFLLFNEIGKLTPQDLGVKQAGKIFHIIAMADPQGGDAFMSNKLRTRMRIHNAFIEESVALVNRLPIDPLFTMVIGDIVDGWGHPKDYQRMQDFLTKLKTPVLYELGNHETKHKSFHGKGYDMALFDAYFTAQKKINGSEKLLYSFDAGEWHFIVWPDPLREGFWETHPHYFEWLEKDLAGHKDKPVMVFQHVPSHPIGISPLINYCESVDVKRRFLDILAKQGNVKYVLSGHVHIPVKASIKTAVSYKGMKLINLPAAGFRPRAFGEADYYGGPSQGVAIVEFKGKKASIRYKCVTDEEYEYPEILPEFDEKQYALWLNHKWELPTSNKIRNGEFRNGLADWTPRYVYREDDDPSNICEVRSTDKGENKALYLSTRRREYLAPGQDRWPQDINRIAQAIKITPGKNQLVEFAYKLDKDNCDLDGICGGFVWIEGYEKSVKLLNVMYSMNWSWYNIGGKNSLIRQVPPVQVDLPVQSDSWQKAVLNPIQDYHLFNENKPCDTSNLDRLVLNFGTWHINDGKPQPFSIFVNRVSTRQGDIHSIVNNEKISKKPKEREWWRGKLTPFTHTAGEHRYHLATDARYGIDKK